MCLLKIDFYFFDILGPVGDIMSFRFKCFHNIINIINILYRGGDILSAKYFDTVHYSFPRTVDSYFFGRAE